METQVKVENQFWDKPESNIVTLTGLDDLLLDGDKIVNFVTGDPNSNDSAYDQ